MGSVSPSTAASSLYTLMSSPLLWARQNPTRPRPFSLQSSIIWWISCWASSKSLRASEPASQRSRVQSLSLNSSFKTCSSSCFLWSFKLLVFKTRDHFWSSVTGFYCISQRNDFLILVLCCRRFSFHLSSFLTFLRKRCTRPDIPRF